jgi:hypothetical protein
VSNTKGGTLSAGSTNSQARIQCGLESDQIRFCITEVNMAPKHIVFLIYDKMEVLDFSGPFDVFSMAILTQLRTGSRRAI